MSRLQGRKGHDGASLLHLYPCLNFLDHISIWEGLLCYRGKGFRFAIHGRPTVFWMHLAVLLDNAFEFLPFLAACINYCMRTFLHQTLLFNVSNCSFQATSSCFWEIFCILIYLEFFFFFFLIVVPILQSYQTFILQSSP